MPQPQGKSAVNIAIKNYLKSGDSVTLGFDSEAKKIHSYDMQSFLDNPKDDPVKLAMTFAALFDGTGDQFGIHENWSLNSDQPRRAVSRGE